MSCFPVAAHACGNLLFKSSQKSTRENQGDQGALPLPYMPKSEYHSPLWSVFQHIFHGFETPAQRVLHFSLDSYESVRCVRTWRCCFNKNWAFPLCESNPKSHSEALLLLILKYCFFKHHMFLCMFINFIRDILFMVFMTTPENAEIDPVRANPNPSSMFSTAFAVTAASEMWKNKPTFYQFLSQSLENHISHLIALVLMSKQQWR